MAEQNNLPSDALAEVLSFLPFTALQTKTLVNRQMNGLVSDQTERVLQMAGVGEQEFMQHLLSVTVRRAHSAEAQLAAEQHVLSITRNEQVSIRSNLEAWARLPIFEHLKMDGVLTRLHVLTNAAGEVEQKCRRYEKALQDATRELELVTEAVRRSEMNKE
jgi:hypothetical protein